MGKWISKMHGWVDEDDGGFVDPWLGSWVDGCSELVVGCDTVGA